MEHNAPSCFSYVIHLNSGLWVALNNIINPKVRLFVTFSRKPLNLFMIFVTEIDPVVVYSLFLCRSKS